MMQQISFESFTRDKQFLHEDVYMTIGVFDGLHVGHMALLQRIQQHNSYGTAMLFTFNPNPKQVLGKQVYHRNIMTLRQKTELIANNHIENMVLIDFSPEFSKLRGERFFSLISSSCNLKYVVFGENFSCGYQALFRAEDIQGMYSETETKVEVVPSVMQSGIRVSSSRIRSLLHTGDVRTANILLGRYYSIDMANIPHIVGASTFDIEYTKSINQILPPPGSYNAAFSLFNGKCFHGEIHMNHDTMTCISEEVIPSQISEMRLVEKIGE